jgi:uncharacterized protein YegP (UPF0339 family)
MPAQYMIKKSSDNQYYFNLTAENNEIILTSEMYVSKSGAQDGIAAVKKNSPRDDRFDRHNSTDGKHYFTLKAANNEVIGKSETYNSEEAMEGGIRAVKRVGAYSQVSDQT